MRGSHQRQMNRGKVYFNLAPMGHYSVHQILFGSITFFLFDKFANCPYAPTNTAHKQHKACEDGKEDVSDTI